MKTIEYDRLVELAEEIDLEEDSVRTDYSGRGMYGGTCVGFDLESTAQLFHLGQAVESLGLNDSFGSPSIDSMGLGIIAYFRGTQCPDAPKRVDDWDEDEDEEDQDDDS